MSQRRLGLHLTWIVVGLIGVATSIDAAEVVADVAATPVLEDRYPRATVAFAGGVESLPDLIYATPAGFRPLRLDLYRPKQTSSLQRGYPLVIYIHGGGWFSGHTRHSGAFENWPNVLASLAAKGYVVASIEYRLSSEAKFPAAIQDVKTSIRWLRSKALDFGIDGSRVIVWGGSAGGQLAALAATSCDVPALAPVITAEETNSSLVSISDCVQGAVAWYGIFDFAHLPEVSTGANSTAAKYLGCIPGKCKAIAALASPVTHLDAKDPPVLLIHGEGDKVVPVDQSRAFQAALQSRKVSSKLMVIPAVDHSFIGRSATATREASLAALSATFGFIDDTVGKNTSAGNTECGDVDGHAFICGAVRPEDIARIPGTRWLIFSGFANGAGLKLVDSRKRTMRFWYTAEPSQIEHNAQRFPACRSAPDANVFNTQGLSLRSIKATQQDLYVANHGGRESIEVFRIDSATDEPQLRWIGCVTMPDATAANSVATYADGTILASVLTRPGTSITDFVRGEMTGAVYQWRPGEPGFSLLPGTELPGNNGIETSPDDQEFYVVAFGWHAVVVFSRYDTRQALRKVVAPGFMPDNIHWDGQRLILAGMQFDEPACGGIRRIIDGVADDMRCHRGYVVAALEPLKLQFSIIAYAAPNPVFNGVSTARVLDQELWLASYQGERIAVRALPGRR